MYDFCRNEDCKAPLQHTVRKRDHQDNVLNVETILMLQD
jgi:hypothetical protein